MTTGPWPCSAIPDRLRRSALEGAARPAEPLPETSGAAFDLQLEAALRGRLPLAERLALRCSLRCSKAALLAARLGRLRTAADGFARARAALDSESLLDETKAIGSAFNGAAEAYLDYRSGAYTAAIRGLRACVAIDDRLESDHGYKILHLHKLQLVENIVRVDARRGRPGDAVRLAVHLLDYLGRAAPELPVPGAWGGDRLDLLPPALCNAMWVQIFAELPVILAGAGSCGGIGSIHLRALPEHDAGRLCLEWLELMRELSRDRDTVASDRACRFLAEGRRQVPVLWHALLVEIAAVAACAGRPEAGAIRLFVANVLGGMGNVGAVFLRRLDGVDGTGKK
ncbi:hypothetical protein V5E97_08645 [Singulisphaera sp. Ch08]|uniref:Tetratricopeptide repeat protein n=1 Tax=Singulisphaera sp. Ch08 TaxID=3120278 RepID=A0AAU7CLS9_9BACT